MSPETTGTIFCGSRSDRYRLYAAGRLPGPGAGPVRSLLGPCPEEAAIGWYRPADNHLTFQGNIQALFAD